MSFVGLRVDGCVRVERTALGSIVDFVLPNHFVFSRLTFIRFLTRDPPRQSGSCSGIVPEPLAARLGSWAMSCRLMVLYFGLSVKGYPNLGLCRKVCTLLPGRLYSA
jgi:hypothetical protein